MTGTLRSERVPEMVVAMEQVAKLDVKAAQRTTTLLPRCRRRCHNTQKVLKHPPFAAIIAARGVCPVR